MSGSGESELTNKAERGREKANPQAPTTHIEHERVPELLVAITLYHCFGHGQEA